MDTGLVLVFPRDREGHSHVSVFGVRQARPETGGGIRGGVWEPLPPHASDGDGGVGVDQVPPGDRYDRYFTARQRGRSARLGFEERGKDEIERGLEAVQVWFEPVSSAHVCRASFMNHDLPSHGPL